MNSVQRANSILTALHARRAPVNEIMQAKRAWRLEVDKAAARSAIVMAEYRARVASGK